jgi:transcriptional regulator with XRE-family HTH domain
MDYSNRIKVLREQNRLTQEKLAHIMGLETPNFISQIETGKKRVGLSVITKFCSAIGIELSDFFREAPHGVPAGKAIPVIDLQDAHVDTQFDSNARVCTKGVCSIARPADILDDNAYGAIVRGDSMCPALHEKDVVITSPSQKVMENGLAVVGLASQEIFVRKVRPSDGMVILECCNPSAEPKVVRLSDVKFVHPVLWVRYQMPLSLMPHS